jgi:hypothetical protein
MSAEHQKIFDILHDQINKKTDDEKDGVDLLEIAKKLVKKKFS